MKYFFILFFVFTLLLYHTGDKAIAASSTFWNSSIFTSLTGHSQPDIKGMSLVWQAKGGLPGTTSSRDDWEVFLYNLSAGTVSQLTDDADNDILPKTDGISVVWQKDNPATGSQIYLHRITETAPAGGRKISSGSGGNFAPDIDKGSVVWSRQVIENEQTFQPREILFYDAETSTGPKLISRPGQDNSAPRIGDNQIVFQENHQDENSDTLYLYTIGSGQPAQPAPENFKWHNSPQVDGNNMVFTRDDGGSRGIYLLSPSTGISKLSEDSQQDATSLFISGNFVTWTADNTLFLADIAHPAISISTPSNLLETGFTADWTTGSGAPDHYVLYVATDPGFQHLVNGYKGLNIGNVTQYSATELTPGTTYYYRVYAVTNGEIGSRSLPMTVKLPGGFHWPLFLPAVTGAKVL